MNYLSDSLVKRHFEITVLKLEQLLVFRAPSCL